MDPLDIAELRALANAATPTPWRVRKASSGGLLLIRDTAKSVSYMQPMLQIYPEADAIFVYTIRNRVSELLDDAERVHKLERKMQNCARQLRHSLNSQSR